jgi:hypothetical protein
VANSDREPGEQPERIEITVAELLAQRGGSNAPIRRPTRHADTVFGRLSPRRRAAVTAGAVLAAGSVVATALFGPTHLFQSTEPVPTGSHDPDGGHPETGPPGLPHPERPGTHGLGDLPDALNPLTAPPSALPTRAQLTAPGHARPATAADRAGRVRTAGGSRARSASVGDTNRHLNGDMNRNTNRDASSGSGGGSSGSGGGGTSTRMIGSIGTGVVSVAPASVPLDEPAAGLGELTDDNSIASAGSALSSLTRL